MYLHAQWISLDINKMPRLCAVYKCSNVGKHFFPKNETLRAQWIKALRLDERRNIGWNLRKTSTICSDHFKESDFHIIPPIFDGEQGSRKLKTNAVPSILPWMKTIVDLDVAENVTISYYVPDNATTSHDDVLDFTMISSDVPENASMSHNFPESSTHTFSEECDIEFIRSAPKDYTGVGKPITYIEMNSSPVLELESTEQATDPLQLRSYDEFMKEIRQDENLAGFEEKYSIHEDSDGSQNCECTPEVEQKKDACIQTEFESPAFDLYKYKHSDKAMHFYTGLDNYDKFYFVFTTLGNSVNNLEHFYGISPKTLDPLQQFFMSLLVLRQHKTFEEISMMYLISEIQVKNIFVTWVRFMALQWRNIDLWVDKPTVKAFIMPITLKGTYQNTRIVKDATECPIKKPRLPKPQQITSSTNNNRNTVKFLIGIAPSGVITYVSSCYDGSATDRQIFESSNIFQQIDCSDGFKVNKGHNVRDTFLTYGVKDNTPAFIKKGSHRYENTLQENRKDASELIDVEKVMGYLKSYKILTQPMNRTETLLSRDIVFICAMLVNFRCDIIS